MKGAPGGRIMGVDVGEVRLGVAASDPSRRVAMPLVVLESRGHREDAKSLLEIAEDLGAREMVLGLPLGLKGKEGASAERVRRLAGEIKAIAGSRVAVSFWDERFSTCSAERALVEGDLSRRRRRGLRDKVAAAVMLQACLDRRAADAAAGRGVSRVEAGDDEGRRDPKEGWAVAHVDEDDVVVLTDEDGKEHEFSVVDMLEVEGKEYAILLPFSEEEDGEDEAVILRVETDADGQQTLADIEDDEEWDKVADAWESLIEEEEEDDEDRSE